MKSFSPASLVVLVLLALFPLIVVSLGLDYYLGFMTRVLATALVASSLNMLVGYGGMVALGHAGFVGVGAYAMVALGQWGIESLWLQWLLAAICAAFVGLLIGAICVRTRGVYFIMITLAFAQMLYYVVVSLRSLGGDDGYNLSDRPALGFGMDSGNNQTLYFVVLAVCAIVYFVLQVMTHSSFGKALTGQRDNESRMSALGFPTYAIRLQAFVLTAFVAGLGGAMLLTQNGFVSPSSMHWTESAILIVMVVIGGLGHPAGALVGTAIWLVLGEVLRQYTEYWHWPLGLMLILIILLAPNGVCRLPAQLRRPAKPVAGAVRESV